MQQITSEFIQKMGSGIPILGTITKKCAVEKMNDFTFKIVLTQGLNRQIRRMCEYLEYDVTKLQRTRIMNVDLGNLKIGEWRELTTSELDKINKMVSDSTKTEEASKDIHKKKSITQNKRKFTPKSNNRFKSKNNTNSQTKRRRRD